MSDEWDFSSLAPVERPLTGPDKKKYVLVGASVDAAMKYRNASAKAGRWVDGKVAGFDGIADAELVLVENCLCETTEDGRVHYGRNDLPVLVPGARIRQWPADVLRRLFDWVKENSPGLKGDDDTKDALVKKRDAIVAKLAELEAGDPAGDPDLKP